MLLATRLTTMLKEALPKIKIIYSTTLINTLETFQPYSMIPSFALHRKEILITRFRIEHLKLTVPNVIYHFICMLQRLLYHQPSIL